MTELTPEQQIRDMIARTGLTPQEFATAYNNLTPGEIKLSRWCEWCAKGYELDEVYGHPELPAHFESDPAIVELLKETA